MELQYLVKNPQVKPGLLLHIGQRTFTIASLYVQSLRSCSYLRFCWLELRARLDVTDTHFWGSAWNSTSTSSKKRVLGAKSCPTSTLLVIWNSWKTSYLKRRARVRFWTLLGMGTGSPTNFGSRLYVRRKTWISRLWPYGNGLIIELFVRSGFWFLFFYDRLRQKCAR